MSASQVLVLRARDLGASTLAAAERLRSLADLQVCVAVDETRGKSAEAAVDVVGLSFKAVRRLGLYAPEDFAWRCGDYALYLAREQYPQAEGFWLTEDDVRFVGPGFDELNAALVKAGVEFAASRMEPAQLDWYWAQYASACDVEPQRCFFPLIYLTAATVERLLAVRQAHSAQLSRRLVWPNDEAFTATTVRRLGIKAATLSSFGVAYDDKTFSYHDPIAEDDLPKVTSAAASRLAIYHPVLGAEALARKRTRVASHDRREPFFQRKGRAVLKRLNARRRWI